MNIVFMGTPEYADTILKRLLAEKEITVTSVYTQPDKPVGRKKVLTPPPVKVTAEAAGVACYQPYSLKEDGIAGRIEREKPDFIVVAAYGQLLPKAILEIAPCINLHASLLPKYRGASPIQQALLNGDRVTGVTAMLMEEGLDSGPMLAWNVTPIGLNDRKNELFMRLAEMAADLTLKTVKKYRSIRSLPQCDADATYCKKIARRDGLVTFDLPAETIYNRFRAFEGWPGIYLENGLKLLDLALMEGEGEAGKILAIDDDGVVVACKSGALKIKMVQPSSKKAMDALSYIRGKRLKIDDLFI
ncbi:methionyl-tRNA formyltransferase [Hydrogenimonas cancrithermarum]|uniref:Methionyl-tRNA formyltransferase n=1 Tax=Hydrogenimonas cancrithermarum TaxID=2993563 RepID=A0ABN6WTG0_9BACT|nr:methionyl-tRNA formyltransferase [Hydrogenimonas cancrithermarum]BDY12349.1 methionyl-tRNA formyltransferase [Hydrogenimonas cancrithermarum]